MSLSTTLSEARQLYALLSDIENKLGDVEDRARQTQITYADLYNVLQDVFYILKRAGLPEEVTQAISIMQRMIVIANSLRVAMIALQAASGPMGWTLAGLGVATSLISMADMSRRYG